MRTLPLTVPSWIVRRLQAAHGDVAADRRRRHEVIGGGIDDLDVAGDALERFDASRGSHDEVAGDDVGAQARR